jgi:ABC-type polysaccharide/polyol phosphate export permease
MAKLDELVQELQRAEDERTHYTVLSVLVGAILGWVIGVAQLIYIGSWELFYWAYMPMIPFYMALGGGLFGMIIGGSGVFSRSQVSSDTHVDKSPSEIHAA